MGGAQEASTVSMRAVSLWCRHLACIHPQALDIATRSQGQAGSLHHKARTLLPARGTSHNSERFALRDVFLHSSQAGPQSVQVVTEARGEFILHCPHFVDEQITR